MPQSNKQVKFYFGTQQEYDALEIKNDSAFYIITDTQRIYLGEKIYAAPVNIQDINGLGLSDQFLTIFNLEGDNVKNISTVPIINSNGQLKPSGKYLGTSVPADAAFLTEDQVSTLQEIAKNATDLQIAGSAPPNYNNDGLMSYADKQKLNRFPNTLEVATTTENGLMSAEDKRRLNSFGTLAAYTKSENNYTYVNGLMTGQDKKILDEIVDEVDDLTELMENVGDLLNIVEPSVNGQGGKNGLMSAEDKQKLDNLSQPITYDVATSQENGLMSAADKTKLDNIIGISDNAKFKFCTASEYAQMENRAAAIYFVLNDSTLLIKDANDNLLTLGNAGGVASETTPTS